MPTVTVAMAKNIAYAEAIVIIIIQPYQENINQFPLSSRFGYGYCFGHSCGYGYDFITFINWIMYVP